MPGSRRGRRAHAAYPEPGTSPSGEGGHVRPQRDPREGWVGKRIGERRGRHIFDPGVPVQGLRRATSPRVARGPRPLRTAGSPATQTRPRWPSSSSSVLGPRALAGRPNAAALAGPEQTARARRPSGLFPSGVMSQSRPGFQSRVGDGPRAVRPHQPRAPPSSWILTRG